VAGIISSVAEVERFRSVPWLAFATGFVVLVVVLLVSVFDSLGSGVVGFGAVAVAMFALILLVTPFCATIGPGRLVIFRSVGRQKRVSVDDIRRIQKRKSDYADTWRFYFDGGWRQVAGDAGKSLAQRLCQLNPNITTYPDTARTLGRG
jgi:hypothetical protein